MQDLATHTLHPRCSLSPQYAPKSTARTPQILIIPRHQPFISIASKTCTTVQQSHWHNGEFQQLAKQLQKQKKKTLTTQNHPLVFSFSLLPTTTIPSAAFFLASLPSFLHKLPMHRYYPHVPKIINPAAFIKQVLRRA